MEQSSVGRRHGGRRCHCVSRRVDVVSIDGRRCCAVPIHVRQLPRRWIQPGDERRNPTLGQDLFRRRAHGSEHGRRGCGWRQLGCDDCHPPRTLCRLHFRSLRRLAELATSSRKLVRGGADHRTDGILAAAPVEHGHVGGGCVMCRRGQEPRVYLPASTGLGDAAGLRQLRASHHGVHRLGRRLCQVHERLLHHGGWQVWGRCVCDGDGYRTECQHHGPFHQRAGQELVLALRHGRADAASATLLLALGAHFCAVGLDPRLRFRHDADGVRGQLQRGPRRRHPPLRPRPSHRDRCLPEAAMGVPGAGAWLQDPARRLLGAPLLPPVRRPLLHHRRRHPVGLYGSGCRLHCCWLSALRLDLLGARLQPGHLRAGCDRRAGAAGNAGALAPQHARALPAQHATQPLAARDAADVDDREPAVEHLREEQRQRQPGRL
mmetsp:Transcript_61783/g.145645  ORF Transcript_61783/g.145645 Transcript_61783/m.145645 type:complete len:434 (-) Transcript_61783:415-1716(-)